MAGGVDDFMHEKVEVQQHFCTAEDVVISRQERGSATVEILPECSWVTAASVHMSSSPLPDELMAPQRYFLDSFLQSLADQS